MYELYDQSCVVSYVLTVASLITNVNIENLLKVVTQ